MLAVGAGASAGAATLGADAFVSGTTGLLASAATEVVSRTTDLGLGLVESFIIDNYKVGWSPRSYFDGLRKLTRLGGTQKFERTR
jgi:cyanophycinase-like exopeptidase